MTTNFETNNRSRLELNARGYRYNKTLDHAADLLDAHDWTTFNALNPQVQSHASVYRDFRQHYRAAVEAGVIPDDRGPSAA